MAFGPQVAAALDRLANFYNSDGYDPQNNPGGLANGGHRLRFVPSLADVALVVSAVGDLQSQIASGQDLVEAFRQDLSAFGGAPGLADALDAKADITETPRSLNIPAGSNRAAAAAAFTTAGNKTIFLPASEYPFDAVLKPANKNGRIFVEPGAVFPNGKLDLTNLLYPIGAPILSFDLQAVTIGPEYNGFKNVFARGSTVRSTVARGGANVGPAVVAWSGVAEAQVDKSAVWVLNPIGIASADGAVSITNESDSLAMTAGALAINTVFAAVGNFPSLVAMQVQANQPNATFKNGLFFNNRQAGAVNGTYEITQDIPCVSGSYIKADAGGVQKGIDWPAVVFSVCEYDGSSFKVGPTAVPGTGQFASYIRVDSSLTGTPAVQAMGGDGTSAINLTLAALNGGDIIFTTTNRAGPIGARVKHVAGATQYPTFTPSVGGDVTIGSAGGAANSSINLAGTGSGGVKIRGGSSIFIQTNSVGVGFFGATPVAKQNLPAAATDAATTLALANAARTALINLGLAA